jgi:hypothetical protein
MGWRSARGIESSATGVGNALMAAGADERPLGEAVMRASVGEERRRSRLSMLKER